MMQLCAEQKGISESALCAAQELVSEHTPSTSHIAPNFPETTPKNLHDSPGVLAEVALAEHQHIQTI